MEKNIEYVIGKESSPLDTPPFRAYFYWTCEGRLVKSEDYSKSELEVEISSGWRKKSELEIFSEALKRMVNAV